jgi:hypothetical protein
MTFRNLFVIFFSTCAIFSCKPKAGLENVQDTTSATFNPDYSDPAAIQLADSIAASAGGIQAWNDIKYISWSFNNWNFVWSKDEDRVRAESSNFVCLFSLTSETGKLKLDGTEITDKNIIQEKLGPVRLAFAESAQILAMPFNLKRPGAKLSYEGEVTPEGTDIKYNVLEVSIDEAFVSRFDRCRLLVTLPENLIKECTCNRHGDSLRIQFDNYSQHGKIRLSDGHAKNVKIEGELPDNFFSDL